MEEQLAKLFRQIERMGRGLVRCHASAGVIEMYIDKKWTIVMHTPYYCHYYRRLVNFTKIKIFKDCIKIFSRIDGMQFIFRPVKSDVFSIYPNSRICNDDDKRGVIYNGRYFNLPNAAYVVYGTYYDDNFQLIHHFPNPHQRYFTHIINSHQFIGDILIINQTWYLPGCDKDTTEVSEVTVTIQSVTYYHCWGSLHNYLTTPTKLNALGNVNIFNRKDSFIKFALPESTFGLFQVGDIYIAIYDNNLLEQVYERVSPNSGSHTNAAISAD